MKLIEIKKLLKDTLELESELYDFCVECLIKIYGEDSKIAVDEFSEGYELFDIQGCIQSLNCIDNHVQMIKQRRAEIKQQNQESN